MSLVTENISQDSKRWPELMCSIMLENMAAMPQAPECFIYPKHVYKMTESALTDFHNEVWDERGVWLGVELWASARNAVEKIMDVRRLIDQTTGAPMISRFIMSTPLPRETDTSELHSTCLVVDYNLAQFVYFDPWQDSTYPARRHVHANGAMAVIKTAMQLDATTANFSTVLIKGTQVSGATDCVNHMTSFMQEVLRNQQNYWRADPRWAIDRK